ncbi:glutathione S-transferase family protein [Parasedimentitalea psychrophila]|uniref:Glutathione S-transferase C-terminal domain-containing protein n=1 Tax=Parasedimentitalea psychrophila TaxID=2997337 RepID=A0A9Y2KYG0_9RHOB|nr:glutathione S-transferase C-terminal domain-containing protein [Parasedimentitalea psychrophila]WIY24988.1 glutathione S-transferase C-terminal domain-containing protein [Parasedimentitalea psychrophila]
MPKMLINGVLRDKPAQIDGQFHRMPSGFRNQIDANPGSKHPAALDRYHLYLSKACPWCHGVELVLILKGLAEAISITWMYPISSEDGWVIDQSAFDGNDGVPRDHFLYQAYQRAAPDYTGPISVPVLLDKSTSEIISTESADIMRMLNSAFTDVDATGPDLYPTALADEIDLIDSMIQTPIRDGAYRAGFATSQTAYCSAVIALFDALDDIESLLGQRRYLAGSTLTEVDLKLFPTLLRFDPVYVTHFKTDRKRIADYPALSRYLADVLQYPGVAPTINMPHIRAHYFQSHRHINPTGIISIGPELQVMAIPTKGAS